MPSIRRALLGMMLLSLASLALAFTTSELEGRAADVLSGYQALLTAAEACPGGACPEAAAIKTGAAAADAERAQIRADRLTLDPCGNCTELDRTLGQVDQAAGELGQVIVAWDEQG